MEHPIRASSSPRPAQFLRYLHYKGLHPQDLAMAVPKVARWKPAALPKYLPADQVQRVLKACGCKTAFGRRNCAILQLLARRSRPKSPLGQACTYLRNQWETLVAHCDHGCTRIDNNLMENAIKGSALGKKNFLFIGHPKAGERSEIIYSIIASYARHRIDALSYLRDVLSRLPAMTISDDLDALTPARWQPVVASLG